jgi:hypothetical protein
LSGVDPAADSSFENAAREAGQRSVTSARAAGLG